MGVGISFLLGLLVFLSGGVASAAVPQANTGLVGHWPLDEAASASTAADVAGSFDGSYLGASTRSANVPPAMVGFPDPASRDFSGAGGSVSVPNAAALQFTGDMTIAFWMYKTSEAADWQRLVGKGNSTLRNYGVWEESGAGTRILFQQYNASGAAVLNLYSSGSVPTNTWTHVVARVQGTTGALFLQNAASGSATRSGTPATSTDPLTFAYAGFHTYFPGLLDDVRIYNRALGDAEIGILYAGLPGASGVAATPGPGEIQVTWNPSPSPASSYTLLRGPDAGNLSPYQTGLSGTSFLDTNVVTGNSYTYAVVAQLSVGDSARSNTVAAVPDNIQPRYNDHSEGARDGRCGCGTAAGSFPVIPAATASILLLAVSRPRRRRIPG